MAANEMQAVQDLLDELATVKMRVGRALRDKHYAYDFHLPAHEYHEHKADLGSDLRAAVGQVYVATDDLTTQVERREGNGSTVQDEDGLEGLMRLIETAQQVLESRRAELR